MDLTKINDISDSFGSSDLNPLKKKKDDDFFPSSVDVSIMKTDDVSISQKARIAKNGENFTKMIQSLPEVRQELVDEVKEELQEGKLLSDDSFKKTAEELLNYL